MRQMRLDLDSDYGAYCTDEANRRNAESYLLSLACRQAGDQTGIIAPLIGVCQSPQETTEILTKIGEDLLSKANPTAIAMLQGREINDPRVILIIDALLGLAVRAIKNVAVERGLANPNLHNMTPQAFDFWLKNRLHLNQLLKKQNADVFGLLNRKFDLDKVDITQEPIIPLIPDERRQTLLAILPDKLNRNINPEPPPIDTPLGFLARLNMAGSDLFRYFAGEIRERTGTQSLRDKISTLP